MTSVHEWTLKVTNHKGKQIAFQHWWQMSDPTIVGNRIEWSVGIQRFSVIGPMNPAAAEIIAARIADPEKQVKYAAAFADAARADQQETDDLAAAKAGRAAKRNGGANVELTAGQTSALRSDRQRSWAIAGATVMAIAVVGGLLVAYSMEDASDTPSRRVGSCPGGVGHQPDVDPMSLSAQASRSSGYLVGSDGNGGSCVKEDSGFGG